MTDLGGRKILVIEDLFYLAMDVQAILEKAGGEVLGPFSTSAAALDQLRRKEPHCALLDVNLGEGASFDVARALRMRNIPFLFFTGYDASAIPAEFRDVRRLQKPVATAYLLDAIIECCASAGGS